MRRTLALSLTVLALLGLGGTSLAVSGYEAQIVGWDFSFPPGASVLHNVTVEVTCPPGEDFLGRVSMRAGGSTVFTGRVQGSCTGSAVVVDTFAERTEAVPCGTEEDLGGQIRSSTGVRFFIPKIHFISCM